MTRILALAIAIAIAIISSASVSASISNQGQAMSWSNLGSDEFLAIDDPASKQHAAEPAFMVFSGLDGLQALCKYRGLMLDKGAEKYFVFSREERLLPKFGRLCGAIVVVFGQKREGAFGDHEKFVADHEFFHLAFQYEKLGIPLPLFFEDHDYVPDDFYSSLALSIGAESDLLASAVCDFLSKVNNLSLPQQYSILWTIALEWPAENYAYQRYIERGGHIDQYLAMRRELLGTNRYVAGVPFYMAAMSSTNDEGILANGLLLLDKMYNKCKFKSKTLEYLLNSGDGIIQFERF